MDLTDTYAYYNSAPSGVKAASSGISLQHTQQVVQLAVFGAFAFMVVLLQIGSEAQSCPLSAGWEAVMIFP
ncbi:hypothetical protein AGRI_13930 [Alishewanella agri BL06]|uniref:Mercury resistance protein n=1 Tax=Alishewanella agri BL06 TaxID=1195246 RepID=I9DNQ4_9ALTE|nr:hypothetical protein AGRI_13930 [Alishewanella agri BL06]